MSFREVAGHSSAVKILQSSLKEKRLGISYIFYGPSGLGKSFVAKQFAKSLNCQLQDIDCCDNCAPCLRSEKLEYPDLHWLDIREDSQDIRIEQIRILQSEINLKPFEGRAKVFIINNCQALSEEAANCLLKVIEEPPPDSVIILITTNLRLVLPTIGSRCQKIKFSNLKRAHVSEILEKNYRLPWEQSRYLAHYLDGRIGEALSLSRSGFLSQRDIVLNSFLYSSTKTPLEYLFKDKGAAYQILSILMSWFRDVMCAKIGMPSEYWINQDRSSEISHEAKKYTYAQLLSVCATLAKSFEYLKSNVNMKLLTDNIRLSLWKK